MARKKAIDGNGTKLKQNGTEIAGIVSFDTIPGWSRTEIEDTEVGNTSVQTYILGTLKHYNALAFTAKFANSPDIPTGNVEWVIEFPNGATLTFWGELSTLGDVTVSNNNAVQRSCSITLTNLNASGEETAPVAVYGSGSSSSSASA